MSRFVLDASIALTWYFPDEKSKNAEDVLARFASGEHAVVTPFWRHEILNALLFSERRKRITSRITNQFLFELSALPISVDNAFLSGVVFEDVQALCRKHRLTAYDAAYLELAIREKCSIATLDEDLARAAISEGVSRL